MSAAPERVYPDTTELLSPSLVVFKPLVAHNITEMLRIAKAPARLRPHCKTHKMPEVIKMEMAQGITKHKAATFGECEMLADCGVTDIFLSYNLLGPNIARAVRFVQKYPHITFCATADHLVPLKQLSDALTAAGVEMQVAVDLNTGLDRTGVAIGQPAIDLYRQIVELPGVQPGGFHCYDGHNHHPVLTDRQAAVAPLWDRVQTMKAEIVRQGWPIPRLVSGGTGTFPVYAEFEDPLIELAAGTTVLHDTGYGDTFADMPNFVHSALLMTRVISRPAPNIMTLDAGNKAVSPDQPMPTRARLLDIPDAEIQRHNEEHMVVKTSLAERYQPGDVVWAVPRHICTTTYLYPWVYAVDAGGAVLGQWEVRARDRQITI